eukprot:scaffold9666_cov144-Skeletonema_dohrnii-CCMP3373.AAC.1
MGGEERSTQVAVGRQKKGGEERSRPKQNGRKNTSQYSCAGTNTDVSVLKGAERHNIQRSKFHMTAARTEVNNHID